MVQNGAGVHLQQTVGEVKYCILRRNNYWNILYNARFKFFVYPTIYMERDEAQPPWPIDDNESNFTNYALTTKERLFCATGEPQGSYSKPQLKDRIRKKRIERLPQRIQGLIDDILLLKSSDVKFKTNGEWGLISQEIIDIERRAESIIGRNILYSHKEQSDEVQFGFELGYMMKQLHFSDRDKLIWGFILGNYGFDHEYHEYERGRVLDLIEKLKEMEKNREEVGEDFRIRDEVHEKYSEINRNALEEVLERSKINPPIENTSIDKYVFEKLHHTGFKYEESDIESVIQDFISFTAIVELDEIYHKLNDDQKIILSYIQQGVDVGYMLEYVYDNIIEPNKGEKTFTREQLPYTRKRNQAIAALNKLSDKDNYSLKTSYPLFSENTYDQWTMTEYGRLLIHTISRKQGPEWVYKYETEPIEITYQEKRIITHALNEIRMI